MKRFAFQFEALRTVREFAEKEAKEALGKEIALLNALIMDLNRCASTMEDAALKRFSSGVDSIVIYDNYIMRLKNERDGLLTQIKTQEAAVEKARQNYIGASQEYKAIEKLKDKHFAAYKKENVKEAEIEAQNED